jgi:predicted transcriptional regulator
MKWRRQKDVADILGPLELEVMAALWQADVMTVGEVLTKLNDTRRSPLAYTSVQTVMTRLADKGILQRVRKGRAYQYRAATDEQGLLALRAGQRVAELLDDYGDLAIAGFAAALESDPKALETLHRALNGQDDELQK